MSLSRAVKVAVSGLEMQRARMELISSNLANARTTRTPEGGPYRRQLPVIEARAVDGGFAGELGRAVRGVQLSAVELDPRPPVMRFEPGHPDADAEGYVAYPNIDPAEEMVDMLSAVRSYEASVNVVKSVRRMRESALGIVR
jgi:flagellar basal-body rod protein FlgC